MISVLCCWVGSCGGKSRASAGPGTLELLVGALGGPGNVDGTGAAARFGLPQTIASDGADALYVTDDGTVRKLTVSTGAVTTIAGVSGLSGSQDGTGANARFTDAQGIAADGDGNVYVTDTGNNTVRTIIAETGAVTTLAGSPGLSGSDDGTGPEARFNSPADIAIDDGGSLFVADEMNHTIRRVDVASGLVTTLAGSPGVSGSTDGTGAAALFNRPRAIAHDGADHVYVLDDWIRKVEVATGTVTTISTDYEGTLPGFYLPVSLASDAGAGVLYLVDSGNETIVQVNTSTGAAVTLAGEPDASLTQVGGRFADGIGSSAKFAAPQGIASDRQGNLYLADMGNQAVRRVVPATGEVTTIAGSPPPRGVVDGQGGAARFTRPMGLASDGTGNLFVSDRAAPTIRLVAVATGEVRTLAGSPNVNGDQDGLGPAAGFYAPWGLAADGEGNLYVADFSNSAIRRIVIARGEVTTVVDFSDPTSGDLQWLGPENVTHHGGYLYLTGTISHAIVRVVVATGEVSVFAGSQGEPGDDDGIGTEARFYAPAGVATDGGRHLYVADSINATIRRIDLETREVTTLAGSRAAYGSEDGVGAAARFRRPAILAADANGNLYVGDTEDSTVRRIDTTTLVVTTVIGSPGRAAVTLGALPAGLGEPAGLALLPTGELAITDDYAVLMARF